MKKNIKNNIFYRLIKMVENNDYYDLNSENEEYLLEGKYGGSVDIRKKTEKKLLKKWKKPHVKYILQALEQDFL